MRTYDVRIELIRRDLFPRTVEEMRYNARAIESINTRLREEGHQVQVPLLPVGEAQKLLTSTDSEKPAVDLTEQEVKDLGGQMVKLPGTGIIPGGMAANRAFFESGSRFEDWVSELVATIYPDYDFDDENDLYIAEKQTRRQVDEYTDKLDMAWFKAAYGLDEAEARLYKKTRADEIERLTGGDRKKITNEILAQAAAHEACVKLMADGKLKADPVKWEFGQKYQLHITVQEAGLEEELIDQER